MFKFNNHYNRNILLYSSGLNYVCEHDSSHVNVEVIPKILLLQLLLLLLFAKQFLLLNINQILSSLIEIISENVYKIIFEILITSIRRVL